MASVEHLETMGRELKCPICLSLLCSAVSLACNHVFCSACICKSMKSASYCPVCKVPYHRREIRPSPHMDNLVNIYKNMEVAAGVNIFVTQKEPVNKNSEDGQINCEDGKTWTLQGTKQKCQIISKKRKITKNKLNNKAISEIVVTNPSKKRVHVTPYHISETPCGADGLGKHYFPNRSCQINGGLVNHVVDKSRDVSIVSKEKIHSEDRGVPTFDPFFWLREDFNEDGGSENASTPKSEDMASLHAPCFSDIKDTDDCNPASMTPVSKLYAGRSFDSEMFEWTQRACSPELCLTPARNKVKYENGQDKTGEEHEKASFSGFPYGIEISNSSSKRIRQMDDEVNKQSTNCCFDYQGKNSIKRKQRANAQGKNNGKITYEGKKTCLDSVYPDDENNDSSKMAGSGSVDGKRQNKMYSTRKSKKVGGSQMRSEHLKMVQDYATVEVGEQISTEAISCAQQANSEDLQHQKASKNESDSLCINRKMNTRAHLKKNKESVQVDTMAVIPEFTSKLSSKKQIKFPVSKSFVTESGAPISESNRNKSHRINHVIEQKKPEAAFNCQSQMMTDNADGLCEGISVVEKSYKSTYRGNEDEIAENIKLDKKKRREVKMHRKMAEQIKELKTAEVVEKASVDPITVSGGKISARASNLKENEKNDIVENPMMSFGELHVNKDLSLRKCSDAPLPSHSKCAFCHSTEENEVTGDMMHYFEGKPVSADHNGGSNIIHTHKNCAEWAPNVYFQNDSSVNLKRELSRSRRIKCSCCGIKGAALGCFEKNCHKSFHYTCAKLIKQCRWDNAHFVMLCPLHPSSKLPCETSESHGMRRQYKPTNECKMQESILSQLSVRQPQRWPSGSHLKYVLCCSALSSVEKEVVSKFAKMTGFSMSKDWSPHVTHVIASTDENGACKRTIKVLMAITEGKWVLKCDWVKVSMKVELLQDEKQYEIEDVHGIRDGPRLGRLRATEQKPKIFNGFKFYFSGDFTASYKGYLQDLVIAAGGTVLQRKPITRENEKLHDMTSESHLFIIFSLELNEKCDSGQDSSTLNRRKAEAEAIAGISGAKVATNTWILDSIAGCRLQSLGDC